MMPRELFEQNLPLIDRVLPSVCRRHAFPPDESEEFASWAKLRLIEDDYAVFRKWQERASLSTYLTTVVLNLFRDYRIHRWGKWRPSAEAKRLGTVAVQLETLLARDGRSLQEAIGILRTNLGVDRSPAEIEALAGRLPPRVRRRFEGEAALERVPTAERPEDEVHDGELREIAERAQRQLAEALTKLENQERLLLKLRFGDGMAVVDIARLVGEPAKPLYGRIERALGALRRELEQHGVAAAEVAELVGWAGLDFHVDFGVVKEEKGAAGPSSEKEHMA